jgi:putative membrane protein
MAKHVPREKSRYARGVRIAATAIVALVALEHLWFAILEMVLWTKPIGLKTFGKGEKLAKDTASLAMNQGLYNLFLVAGLVWSLVAGEPQARALKLFFLGCVVVAGVFGGITVAKKIAYVQATPAAIGLVLVLLGSG